MQCGRAEPFVAPTIHCMRTNFSPVKLSPLVINIVIVIIIMHALLVVVLLELKHVTQYWWIYVRKELLTALIVIKSSPCSSSCSHETLNKANNHIHDHVADKKPGATVRGGVDASCQKHQNLHPLFHKLHPRHHHDHHHHHHHHCPQFTPLSSLSSLSSSSSSCRLLWTSFWGRHFALTLCHVLSYGAN